VKLPRSVSALGTSHFTLFSSLALGCLGGAIFWGHWIYTHAQLGIPAQLPLLAQDESIQVYFNHNQAVEFTEPYRRKTRRGDDLAAKLIIVINSAQSQIDVAVQELKLPNIAQALADRAKAGVKVRVMLEHNYSRPQSELTPTEIESLTTRDREHYQEFQQLVDIDQDGTLSPTEIDRRDALIILRNAHIPILDDTADGSGGSGLMHHKFMVVDGNQVIVTSANWTMSDIYGDFSRLDTEGNQNNLVQVQSGELAQIFTTEFNLMWGDGTSSSASSQFKAHKTPRPPVEVAIGKTRVLVQFSPSSKQQAWENTSNGLIGKFLTSSQQQIDFALFAFSEPTLGNIIQTQAQQGVKVRGEIDRQFAYRDYSTARSLMGASPEQLCQTSAPANFQPLATIGVPTLPNGDLLHHKFAVLDRRTVITGSHNWSNAANYHNDETLIVIQDNPTVAAHFDREFDRLYQHTIVGIPAKLKRKGCQGEGNEGRTRGQGDGETL
jgi:phosphatidylserine/phosphatidylglycerophosphate/cardiolipin synthase-like enzyme